MELFWYKIIDGSIGGNAFVMATSSLLVTWFITCSLTFSVCGREYYQEKCWIHFECFSFWLCRDRAKESVVSILNDLFIATYGQRVLSTFYTLGNMESRENSVSLWRLWSRIAS